ncbi:MAG TPA: DNA-3-methyladenine glycosylase [Lentimicrobium sp.]|jgi:DNA-3-methyladenine glycosylase|nr:DNA-3-methyladenine glycosylase [Lentimicrobium sp.]
MHDKLPLSPEFYANSDVVLLARKLIGKTLIVMRDGQRREAVITETEAYAGITDRASHAWGGRFTSRTEVMYRRGGLAYVYLCYGLHSLFNVVTGPEGTPHAILLRGVYPVLNDAKMNFGNQVPDDLRKAGNGPGKLSRLMGIDRDMNGADLCSGSDVWITGTGIEIMEDDISVSTRIGIGYAGKDAGLPYRFFIDRAVAEQAIKKTGYF